MALLVLLLIWISNALRHAIPPPNLNLSRSPAIQTQRQYLRKTLSEVLQSSAQLIAGGKDSLLSIDWIVFLTISVSVAAASRTLRLRLFNIDRPWKRIICGPRCYLAFLAIAMIWFRLPVITTPLPLGLDESVFLSGSVTLKHDPIFWRTLESTTSGPLNYYPLMAGEFLGLPPDLAVARLFAALLAAAILVVLYYTCRLIVGDLTSRLAVLPLWMFWITTTQLDFVQYSSDLIPMLLIAAATYCAVRSQLRYGRRSNWFIGCALLIGLLPLAKLQACLGGAAVAACAIAWQLFRGRSRPRRETIALLAAFVITGLLPMGLTLCFVMASGALDRFVVSYLLFNLEFTARRSMPLWRAIVEAIKASFNTPDFGSFAKSVTGITIASVIIAAAFIRLKTISRSARLVGRTALLLSFLLLSGVALLLAVALRGAVGTQWWYYHYLLYFVVPTIPLAAIVVDICWRIIVYRVALRELMIALLFGITLIPGSEHLDATSRSYLIQPRLYPILRRPPEADVAVDLSRPDDTLAVWGWHPDIYVETQLAQATSMSTIERELGTGEHARMVDWFRRQYLQDLKREKPSVFIDTTGDDDQTYVSVQQYGYETFPELRQYITENYVRLQDAHHARIYLSRERYKELGLR